MCQIVINKILLEIDVIVILIVVTFFLFVKGLRIHFTFNTRNFSRFTKATWAITYAHFFFFFRCRQNIEVFRHCSRH